MCVFTRSPHILGHLWIRCRCDIFRQQRTAELFQSTCQSFQGTQCIVYLRSNRVPILYLLVSIPILSCDPVPELHSIIIIALLLDPSIPCSPVSLFVSYIITRYTYTQMPRAESITLKCVMISTAVISCWVLSRCSSVCRLLAC